MWLFVVIPRVRIMQRTRALRFHKRSAAALAATLRPTPDYRLRFEISSGSYSEQSTKWNLVHYVGEKKKSIPIGIRHVIRLHFAISARSVAEIFVLWHERNS